MSNSLIEELRRCKGMIMDILPARIRNEVKHKPLHAVIQALIDLNSENYETACTALQDLQEHRKQYHTDSKKVEAAEQLSQILKTLLGER